MPTAYLSSRLCHLHDTGEEHPENARRLGAIEDRLVETGLFDLLRYVDAPAATDEQLLRVHSAGHLAQIMESIPASGYDRLDPDTVVSPKSLEAARVAAGALVNATDLVLQGTVSNAFCAVRPPGHHAESRRAMGFCLFNNVAVGAAHAMAEYGLERVAIIDFDVHQGNGTEEIFLDEQRVLFCSTFQHPFYPFTPIPEAAANRVNVPLPATARGDAFRAAVENEWLPALDQFRPQMIFVSAGFDGHQDDDMSHVSLADADYRWVSQQIAQVAARYCPGRVVSTLEGGYEHHSLARCVELHLRVLAGMD